MTHALVIEGGGAKAAYASGVVGGFADADYAPWDAVIGTSAGGAIAAWYSAGQREGEDTWRYLADPRVLNYRRFFTRQGPLIDHEALIQHAYIEEITLDTDAVMAAPWPVIVTAADVDTGEVVYQDIRDGDVLDWLRATGRLPFAAGPPVEIDGRRFVDGGVIDPVPVRWAIEQFGASHVTLIRNKPPGPTRPDNRMVLEIAARRFPAIREGLFAHERLKQEANDLAADPPDGVTVDVIYPSKRTGLSRLTRDVHRVYTALELGREDGYRYATQQDA